MQFRPDTLASAHARMASIKAQCHGDIFTNYFRQEMVGQQLFLTGNDRTLLLLNEEYGFFRLYFFTSDLSDLAQMLACAEYPGEVVAGYLTKKVNSEVIAAFEHAAFVGIATYGRMETHQLPQQRPNPALEYALPDDTDQIHADLFRAFNKYTDHLPTKSRFLGYINNQQVIVKRRNRQIIGAVVFQLQGLKVNYNYIYNFSGRGIDFMELQNNFYGVMHERGIHAGFLWINQANERLIAVYKAAGWQFAGLEDYFYFRSSRAQRLCSHLFL
jgi:hypothetical protein